MPKKKQRRKQTSKQREDTNTVYLVVVTGTKKKKKSQNRHQRNRVDTITQDNGRKDKGDRQCLDAELENSTLSRSPSVFKEKSLARMPS